VLRLVSTGAALATAAAAALLVLAPAAAHRSGCHRAHTCPSDHHTYVWVDPRDGKPWDCAEPGAPEYDPARDTTTIVWDGRTYHCRPAGNGAPVSSPGASAAPYRSRLLGPRRRSSGCHVHGPLPDRSCSPGAVFVGVSLAAICAPGYSSRVRSVGEAERGSIFREYGLPFLRYGGAYEVDHIVALELGGSNEAANLYPEAAVPAPGYHVKDRLENRLHRLVCAGQLLLGSVQREIARNWVALYAKVSGTSP
jgi:hypothetical protein